jgi:hypothetical protein
MSVKALDSPVIGELIAKSGVYAIEAAAGCARQGFPDA